MASIQTHNVKHSLRAGANKKASQRQQQAQKQQQEQQPEAGPSRAAPPSQDVARKAVFKQVLGSPLTVNWPSVAAVDAQPILYTLLDLLRHEALHPYTRIDGQAKDTRLMTKGKRRQARKADSSGAKETALPSSPSSSPTSDQPLVYGINAVTRRLETMVADRAAGEENTEADTDIALVCRSDLDPPKLVAHIPLLACSVNAVCFPASRPGGRALRVVPLPEGAEALLADALGVRRCGAVGLSSEKLPLQDLITRIQEANVAPLRASWLDAAAQCALSTRTKLARPAGATTPATATTSTSSGEGAGKGEELRFEARPNVISVATTAPVNLNAVKLAKKHTRQEKKEWRKAKRKQSHQVVVAATKRNRRQRRAARGRGTAAGGAAAAAAEVAASSRNDTI